METEHPMREQLAGFVVGIKNCRADADRHLYAGRQHGKRRFAAVPAHCRIMNNLAFWKEGA